MEKISVIENCLIPVYKTSIGERIVYASELYRGLKINIEYNKWIRKKLHECKAIENEDYYVYIKRSGSLADGCSSLEYMIKIDIAKHIMELEIKEKGGYGHE